MGLVYTNTVMISNAMFQRVKKMGTKGQKCSEKFRVQSSKLTKFE